MSTLLYCVGDMHLGRRPSRLPPELCDLGVVPAGITPASAWRGLVEQALEDRPRALLLAGDVVDSANARFEAWGPLEEGIRRLVEAGIQVLAVAGNHDGDVLPRMADRIEGFRLLGRGGRWETHDLPGSPPVRIVGWSFPAARQRTSPLEPPPRIEAGDGPAIGLLHCDLDAGESPYAPVARRALEELPLQAWLLGHQHQPTIEPGPRPIGYLGSLLGLDPGEPGERGAWTLVVDEGGGIDLHRLPSRLLRWEPCRIDCSQLDADAGEDEVIDAVRAEMRRLADAVAEASGAVDVLGLRCELSGRTPAWKTIDDVVRGPLKRLQISINTAGGLTAVFLERLICSVRPRLDLQALSARGDLPAALATRLLALERGDAEAAHLMRAMRSAISDDAARHRLGAGADWEDRELRENALAIGEQLLDRLLAQVEEDGR